ncbi:MAG: VWA domain-containing protein [Planctomycetes bacterium]|nr:VWA domain-containing protein [Planctomycetota bacterium]
MRVVPLRVSVATAVVAAASLVGCTSSAGAPSLSHHARRGAAPLVGGVTDDNVRLPEYLAYVDAYPHGDVPKLDLTDRQVLTVRDGDTGAPLWDEKIVVDTPSGPYLARTNAAGSVTFPRAALGASGLACRARVRDHGEATVVPGADDVLVRGVRRRPTSAPALDVALVVDTTGSMSDEVARLRATLTSVVARLDAHPSRPDVRVALLAYRDVGDRYVTRPTDFTDDVGLVQRQLDRMEAGGGGDTPEAVQEALDEAVNRLAWRPEGAVRVLFLVGDAPPHFERGVPYTVTMRRALERGITILPVACSGLDDRGEFVWRQLAAVTLGQFLFVSYGGTTDHHTGPYLENDLDVLMTRAVLAQLDALQTGAAASAPVVVPAAPPVTVASGPRWAAPPPSPYARPFAPPAPVPSPMPVERVAPDPWAPSATWGAQGDRLGRGRAPWEFGIPGWGR